MKISLIRLASSQTTLHNQVPGARHWNMTKKWKCWVHQVTFLCFLQSFLQRNPKQRLKHSLGYTGLISIISARHCTIIFITTMKNNPMELWKLISVLHRQFSQSIRQLNPRRVRVGFFFFFLYVVSMVQFFVTALKLQWFLSMFDEDFSKACDCPFC